VDTRARRREKTFFASRLEQNASSARALPAFATPEREISYAELLARVQRCASWLARNRYAPEEVVGVTIAEELPHLVTSLALLVLGVPHICLPTHDPGAKRMNLAQRIPVRRVITTDAQYALPGLETLLLTPQRWEAAGGAWPDPVETDLDAPALYYTSSGTTGEPKIYPFSQRWLAWRSERQAESHRIEGDYRSLMLVSVEDSFAKSRLLYCAYLGLTSVLPKSPCAPRLPVQEICAKFRVSCLELSALQVASLVVDSTDPRPLPVGTRVFTAGAAVSSDLRRQFAERFGVPLFIHYGAREFGRISSTFPDQGNGDLESVGRPVPWIDLEIVDGDDEVLSQGEIGEIRVRCDHMLRAYHRDPIATARHFKDGWFYPRDLGSLNARGELCLYGRSDDMMNLNGIKIFPAEIERVLEAHPAVKAAAAFPKTSAAHGDIPMAAVELHRSASVGVEELLARARELLGVRAPRKIIVLDSLPRNSSGKIVKRELADWLVADK
jgi:acyl-CoA synthetase (AMP-forming)/AMP-acid ligase II